MVYVNIQTMGMSKNTVQPQAEMALWMGRLCLTLRVDKFLDPSMCKEDLVSRLGHFRPTFAVYV